MILNYFYRSGKNPQEEGLKPSRQSKYGSNPLKEGLKDPFFLCIQKKVLQAD
ncbi:hypothetical protein Slin_6014 [Spirosoma linguale DSM 74]|uniref:Uncharacterized protein n=1 Tax=Spirosoma linguale (strain ATCC 33905 / DSM 74 / LMG 10896 / Claus 1) TaxID=504472 RepID=D2QT44_SPILD|nr:hypothetical protein Slin_6014 [Spirosoma linguale DSM 74]